VERTCNRHPDHILQVDSQAFLNTLYLPSEFLGEHPGHLFLDLLTNGNMVLRECLFQRRERCSAEVQSRNPDTRIHDDNHLPPERLANMRPRSSSTKRSTSASV